MIRLNPSSEAPPRRLRRYRFLKVTFLLILAGVAALLVERWRGQWALNQLKYQLVAKGEVIERSRLWAKPSAQGLAFSNDLRRAVAQLQPGLNRYAGRVSAIVIEEPGFARRGSQEPSPVPDTNGPETNTWEDLEAQVEQVRPALELLRSILHNPPPDLGYDPVATLETFAVPNYVPVRCAAQALQAAALSDLHRGDLAGAKNNLLALAAFKKLNAGDPALVPCMIRVAVLGLSVEAAWDALQADGWTDAQLAELQQGFQCDDFLAQLPRAMEAERASWLFEYGWFSSHSYLAWVDRYQPIYQAFGQNTPPSPQVLATRYYREWVSHPLWRFAWAHQEQVEYLKTFQLELNALRDAVKTGSWTQLSRQMDSIREAYRAPLAAWRFYFELPMPHQVVSPADKQSYPCPQFKRAWFTSMKNLTLGQMVTAALALKRYEIRHGKPPEALQALVPEYLARVPLDFMDGQPLRYRIRTDGSWCLYSVGENCQDDLGTATPPDGSHQPGSAWNGRDWVWPQVRLRSR